MKNNFKANILSKNELTRINGGEGRHPVPYDPSIFLFKWLYEFVTGAAEFQASLPPNLKK